MTNSNIVSRAQLIFGLCLPLAVLLGYLLAEPLESSNLGVIVLVFAVLTVPLLMRWYHPMLMFSLNSIFFLGFIQGMLPLWIALASSGFVIVFLNRCVDSKRRLMVEGNVARSLAALAIVVALTALFSGGIGIRALGSSVYGGRRYLLIVAAIMTYFVLASKRVPPGRAVWYVGLFFLPGISALLSNLVYMGGSRLYNLYYIIPSSLATSQVLADTNVGNMDMVRFGGCSVAANAICLFLLARYGVRGILDLGRPWRFVSMMFFMVAGLYGGFRSYIICLSLILVIAFFLEGLHRTRFLPATLALGLICGVGLVSFSTKLPHSVQRALSFLPIDIDLAAKQDAEGSVNWRLDMWREAVPDIPRYLLKGKGYTLNPNDLFMSQVNTSRSIGLQAETALLAGDYHNGPLSVLIPFGIWGALALGWFFFASGRVLYLNCVYGNPALRTINRALLACFLGRMIFFVSFILPGALDTDLPFFTGLIGLAVSLNGETKDLAQGQQSEAIPAAAALGTGEAA